MSVSFREVYAVYYLWISFLCILSAEPCIRPLARTNRMRGHFPFEPICYLLWIKADGRSHSEEWNMVVLHFLIEGSNGYAE